MIRAPAVGEAVTPNGAGKKGSGRKVTANHGWQHGLTWVVRWFERIPVAAAGAGNEENRQHGQPMSRRAQVCHHGNTLVLEQGWKKSNRSPPWIPAFAGMTIISSPGTEVSPGVGVRRPASQALADPDTSFVFTVYRLPSTVYRLPSTAYRLPPTAYHLPHRLASSQAARGVTRCLAMLPGTTPHPAARRAFPMMDRMHHAPVLPDGEVNRVGETGYTSCPKASKYEGKRIGALTNPCESSLNSADECFGHPLGTLVVPHSTFGELRVGDRLNADRKVHLRVARIRASTSAAGRASEGFRSRSARRRPSSAWSSGERGSGSWSRLSQISPMRSRRSSGESFR